MALTDYTTYDEIRASLGVSSDEIEDTTLGLAMYSDYLDLELDDIDSDIASQFTTVKAIAEGSRTAAEARFYKATTLFAVYAVARQLTVSLPLFSPKDISDGKATLGRYADSPYRETIKRVKDEYEKFRVRLKDTFDALNATTTTPVTRSYMGVSSPDTDVVTGS